MTVSIPLIQGKVFRRGDMFTTARSPRFNPFDTGQGLSTKEIDGDRSEMIVSIPLIQGKVFRQVDECQYRVELLFQSL